MSFTALLNPQTSKLLCLFPSTPLSRTTNISQPTFLKFPINLNLSSSFQSSHSAQNDNVSHEEEEEEEEEEEDFVIGDCVVFEEGVFDDPYVIQNFEPINQNVNRTKPRKRDVEIKTENLVPDEWREVQAEINITKKERRKIAQELQFGTRVEKKRKGLVPLRNVNLEEYLAYKEAKSKQLKPLVLDNPTSFKNGIVEKDGNEWEESEMNNGSSSERVKPKDPRWEVYGKGLDDVTEFFKKYKPGDKKSEGPRKLFSQEEKVLLNRRTPDLRAATSEKWLPLHTLVASGEFYLVNVILKHKADINAMDNDGWTALHKAIIGKKQAIMNYLLRESANPFVRDKDGATLMHYAVRTASSQAIKILLLYDVDINLPDNYGWTPLHLAVQARRTDLVRLLLIKGADKTIKNEDGLTPLNLCLYHGPDTRTYELLKLLKLFPKPR